MLMRNGSFWSQALILSAQCLTRRMRYYCSALRRYTARTPAQRWRRARAHRPVRRRWWAAAARCLPYLQVGAWGWGLVPSPRVAHCSPRAFHPPPPRGVAVVAAHAADAALVVVGRTHDRAHVRPSPPLVTRLRLWEAREV